MQPPKIFVSTVLKVGVEFVTQKRLRKAFWVEELFVHRHEYSTREALGMARAARRRWVVGWRSARLSLCFAGHTQVYRLGECGSGNRHSLPRSSASHRTKGLLPSSLASGWKRRLKKVRVWEFRGLCSTETFSLLKNQLLLDFNPACISQTG